MKIPNDMALYVAFQEIIRTRKLIKELEEIEPEAGAFLNPFIHDLQNEISRYLAAKGNQ